MGYAVITGGPRSFRFRIDPHAMSWDYSLNTSVRETIGGQVIQLLSVNLGNFRIEAVSGSGGEAYKRGVITYFRDLALWQRDNDQSVNFLYSPRSLNMKVFFREMTISDRIDNVNRDFSISFSIDEDVSGSLRKVTMTEALERIEKGVGYDSPGLLDSATTAASAGLSAVEGVINGPYGDAQAHPRASGAATPMRGSAEASR